MLPDGCDSKTHYHDSHFSDNGQQGVEPVECVVVLGEVLRELGQEQPEGAIHK